jgi:predicted transcriptional regulator
MQINFQEWILKTRSELFKIDLKSFLAFLNRKLEDFAKKGHLFFPTLYAIGFGQLDFDFWRHLDFAHTLTFKKIMATIQIFMNLSPGIEMDRLRCTELRVWDFRT